MLPQIIEIDREGPEDCLQGMQLLESFKVMLT